DPAGAALCARSTGSSFFLSLSPKGSPKRPISQPPICFLPTTRVGTRLAPGLSLRDCADQSQLASGNPESGPCARKPCTRRGPAWYVHPALQRRIVRSSAVVAIAAAPLALAACGGGARQDANEPSG